MKKFFSYLLTFVSLFAISTVVTIQSQADLLNNQPSSSAGASSPTTLLAGIMESIEQNPKLDINGEVAVDYNGELIGVTLDADIDLTTLTNPSIMASVGLSIYGHNYQILLTYAKDEIFLSCQNVSIQSKISEITDIAGLIGSLIGQPMAMPSIDLSSISLDSIMEALNNPQKKEVDNSTFYTITLPQIAKITIATDDQFNIQSITIDEFYMVEGLNIECGIKVSQDNNIDIVSPDDSDQYLNIAGLIDGLVALKDKNMQLSAITNIYKGQLLFERVESIGFAQISQNKYQLKNSVSGVLDASLDINYLNDVIYAKLNNIGVSVEKQDIQYLKDLLNNIQTGEAVFQTADVLEDFLVWLENNYNSILDNATIASNQITLVLPMDGILGQTQDVKIVLKIKDLQIEAISFSGISVGDYIIYTTIYVRESQNYEISVTEDEYFKLSTATAIIDWLKQIKTIDVSAGLQVDFGEGATRVDLSAQFDTINNRQQIKTTLFDMPISVLQQDGNLYVNINDMYVSAKMQSIYGLLSQIIPQGQVDQLLNSISRVATNLSINDILTLIDIETTNNSIKISTNLSHLIGKTLKLDICLAFDNGFVLTINQLQYDSISISGEVSATNIDEELEISNADKYLDVEDFIDYVDQFVCSQNYSISGRVDFSGYGIDQVFDGLITLDLANESLQISGLLTGKLNADIDIVYADAICYVTYNNQRISISKQKLELLLNNFGIDIQPLLNSASQFVADKNNFSLKDYLNSILRNPQELLNTAQEVESSNKEQITIDRVIELIKNVKISKTNISADFSTLGYNIQFELGSHNDISLNFAMDEQVSIDASLQMGKQQAQYVVDGNFVNLDLLVPRMLTVTDLLKHKHFSGRVSIDMGELRQPIIVDYKASFSDDIKLSLTTNIEGLGVEFLYINGGMFVKIGDICATVTTDQLMYIASRLFEDQITEIYNTLTQTLDMSLDDVLDAIYQITTGDPIISNLYNSEGSTHITLLNMLEIVLEEEPNKLQLAVHYQDFNVGVSVNYGEETQISAPLRYLNIVDFVTKIDEWLTSSTYTISGEIDFSGYGIDQKFNGDISVDFQNIALAIDGKLTGRINADIKLIYANEKFFVTYNKQNFVISQDQLVKLLQEFGIDISGVFDQIQEIANIKSSLSLSSIANRLLGMQPLSQEETSSIDTQQIVEVVKNITVNSTQIAFNGALGGVNIDINIPFGAIISPNVSIISQEMQIFLGLNLSKQVEQTKFDTTNSAFSLDNSANIVNGLLNTISDSKFSGEIYLNWGEQNTQTISVTYDINIIDSKLYGKLVATYLGQDITLYIIENKLYVNVKGIYIKATFEQIEQILQAELPQDIKTQIDNKIAELQSQTNDIFKLIEDITNTECVEDLQITPNSISISVMGTHIDVGIANNKISTISLEYSNISATITLSSSESSQQLSVEEDVYQDIDNIYNLVKNVYNYAMAQEFNFDIRLNAFGYDIVGFVGYNQGLTAHLTTTLLDETLLLDIIDETIYINFDGLTLHIAFADIPALLEEINTQFNLGISQDILNVINRLLATKDIAIANIENLTGSQEPINLLDVLETLVINWFAGQIEVSYDIVNLTVEIVNNMISKLALNAEINDQNIVAEVVLCDSKSFALPNAGIDIADATTFVKYIAKLVNKTQYAGEFSLAYTDIQLDGRYKLVIVDNKLSAQISTIFYDLPISVIIVDDIVYAQIDHVKIYLPLSEINNLTQWINNSFNQTLPTDINISTNLAEATGELSIDGITLGDIVIAIAEEILSIRYNDLSANIGFADSTQISISYKDVSANLSLSITDEEVVAPDGYLHYTQFTNIVDSLVDLYNSGNISATARAYVYEGQNLHYTADCTLQIDLNSRLVFVSVNIVDEFKDSTIALMLAYKEDFWYVDYNNLKLKINKTDLKEILAILLEMVGIDPNLLPFLRDVVGGLDVNTDSLTAIVPQLDFTNPLSLIDVFEKISLTVDELDVEVDNSLIAGELNSENILATLKTQNGKLNYISLNNLYTGTTDYETLDFKLNFQDFNGVSDPYQGTYIDLSGANELIKAIINTAELNYFEITATIDVDMKIIGISISMSVPINVKIRLDENRKPEMMISLGSIPSIVGVNNDISGIDSRMWYIYYKDSYIYMLRHDIDNGSIFSSGTVYQKQIKLHVDSFFDDFFYYLQWGVGFSDMIMTEIEKALALTDGWTPDLGKVINSFTVTDAQNFSVDINMGEVANNPQIDNMVVNLGVVNNAETNNKNYIGTAQFYLYMPVASGVDINLVSKDMKLINIGKSFDFTDFEKFVYNYVGTEGTEYSRDWNASNGIAWDYDGKTWQLASEREYTITFNSQGGQDVSAITGKTNQEITLPTLADKIVVDADAGIRYTYAFAGWYETELCKNGTEFTINTIPKKNITLYAKWILSETERVVTILFDSAGGSSINSISGYAGSQVDVSGYIPTKQDSYVYKKETGALWWKKYIYDKTIYTFDGWYVDSACTIKFDGVIPESNIILYAKWIGTTTEVQLDSKVN